ncbi:FAD-dependent monooxygenase [Streptomyces sp. NBC_01754]|uniref:FAD-dependent oxidoreductase n=1 Tax=Streptomyces sp. NBC_01754 TaxID=2975930 RepID=UPI002DD9C3F3|nr:FAD-dependent oxidoreductase [Streptomyces sp. NBC_01754]WSC95712.1 FAD-dependent monooxygenase [Streptomyces sp. NBC_01754]
MAATGLRMGVVGGSVAGCATAVAGVRAGADVTVYERSAGALQDRGLGVVVPPSLHERLVGAGYLDAAMPTAPVATRVWLTRAAGGRSAREFARQPSPVTPCNWGLLWQALRTAASGAHHHRGRPVTSVGRAPAGRAVVRTAEGEETYDVVVGADGHASLTRQALAPGLRPSPAGYTVWRGTLPLSALTDHRRPLELLREAWVTIGFPGGHGIFYLIPRGGGAGPDDRLLAYAVYATPPGPPPGEVAHVRDVAERYFPEEWADIVARGEHTAMTCHPVTDLHAPLAADPPFLLAGDAAGVTRPHTASGAVKALQDALCLEEALRTCASPAEALRSYARERTPEGARLVELGRRLGRAQVEQTPDWAALDQEAVDAWCRATLAGATSYLYARVAPEAQAQADPVGD